jgi:hypothetical protein
MLATKREQQPFVYGSLSKEAIYLKPPASPTSVIASTMTHAPAQVEQSPNNQKRDPVGGAEQNSYTPEDAQRVAARGAELNLKIPAFAIGDTKVNVPVSFRRYVLAGQKNLREAVLHPAEAVCDVLEAAAIEDRFLHAGDEPETQMLCDFTNFSQE